LTTYGLTSDGFVAKTLDDIEASIVARQRADIDPNLDTSQYEVIGQLNGIVADDLAQLWEVAEALHDAMDPDKATGESQDTLYSLTNTLREGAKKSSVVATVTLAPGANISAGAAQASVNGNPAAKFINTVAMVNGGGSPASFQVVYEAVNAGPVAANAGTLTNIDTPAVGWSAITNALDAELGANIEDDAIYRLRRVDELAAQGGGTVPGLRADLLNMATVRAATVLENFSNDIVNGLPPKSFEAVVRSVVGASDDAAIGQIIWDNKPLGIEPFGLVLVNVTDEEGYVRPVKFSRPYEMPVYIALRLLTSSAYGGDAATKAALVSFLEDPGSPNFLEIGADVYAGRIVAALMLLPGVLNADARVSLAAIVSFDLASSTVVIGQREIAALDTSRISISAFP
jgi:hypothetical protein